jgi:dTDP-4-dehydrorhamnose reductase
MIWLIGNKGMLGTDVELLLRDLQIKYIASDKEVDILDYGALENYIDNKKISWIINCSAYTAVDKAEDEAALAYKINSNGVLNIAGIANTCKARLIHLSTDYVFDGNKKEAYTEDDIPNPAGVYGKSKLEGEKNIRKTIQEYYIIRIAWLYGQFGGNFVHTMLRLFSERDEVRVVRDQWGSPTYTKDVAAMIMKVVANNTDKFGIYNYTNEGRINWYDFASRIYALAKQSGLINKEVNIIPITTEEYPTKAVRPKNSYLSKDKIRQAFGLHIRPWHEALEDFMQSKNKA